MANNLIMQMVLVYLLFFYTDIFGIPAGVAGTMFLVSRILDAFADIVMGYIVDRTSTRWGKMRPYLLFGSIPFGLAAVFCFITPDLSQVGKIAWAYVTYNLLSITLTVVTIPYASLSSALTQAPKERVSLSVWRTLFGVAGGITVNIVTPVVAPKITGGNLQSGYALTMGIYAVVGVVVYILVFATTKEVYSTPKRERTPISLMVKATLGNRYVLLLSACMALAIGSTNIRASGIVYYFTYYLGRADLLPAYFLTVYLSIAVGMALVGPVAKRFGRRNVLFGSLIFFAVVNSAIAFGTQTTPWVAFTLSAIGGVATAFASSLPLALMPDAVEVAEWKYGVRTEGVIFSFNSFAQKIAMALGGGIPAWILAMSGYVPDAEQTARTLRGIVAIMSWVPGVVLAAAAAFILFYNMTETRYAQIVSDLRNRAAGRAPQSEPLNAADGREG
jgi:sugar (glycoside-pentoside-hexuronide) transporter